MTTRRHTFPHAAARFVAIGTTLCALVLLAGCASTNVTDRQRVVTGPIPRPQTIWVFDFVASADAVPANSALTHRWEVQPSSQTAEQAAEGRRLGAAIAAELVKEIEAMGMSAMRGSDRSLISINDLVLKGYLVSVEEGSGAKRVVIGLDKGGSQLRTIAEGFQMRPEGLRKLGSGSVTAKGAKTPGTALGVVGLVAMGSPVGLVVGGGVKAYEEMSGKAGVDGRAKASAQAVAEVLKERFKEEGWID